MAKAIVRNPCAFLMDEPLAALDAALRQSLRTELVVLQKRMGTTTIFVTHDQIEAMTMGDMIVVMNEGRVEQVGSPDEIYNHPATRFVAGFIGTPPMNFIDGEIISEKDVLILATPVGRFEIPEHLRAQAGDGKNMQSLGVRPQHLRITRRQGVNAIRGEVFAVENLGKEAIIVLHDEDRRLYRAIVNAAHSYKIGDKVYMVPELKSAHLFWG